MEPERRYSRLYNRLATRRIFWLFAVLAVCSQTAIIAVLHRGMDPLDLVRMQTTFSKAAFFGIVGNWGEASWQAFYRHYWLDFFHPLVYGAFLASALARLLARRNALGGRGRHLLLVPFAAAVCDEIENVCQLYLTIHLPDFSVPLFFAGALAANVKWAAVAVTVGAIVVLGLRPAGSPAAVSRRDYGSTKE